MSNILFKDGGGSSRYRKGMGVGTDDDPFVPSEAGTPVAGALAATTTGAPLSDEEVPCRGVMVFPTDAQADVYIGDEDSQPCRVPGVGLWIPVDDVSKLYGRLSASTGTIPWIAIV